MAKNTTYPSNGLGTGGQNTGITTAPVQLTTTATPCVEVVVQSDPGNSTNMLVGGSLGQPLVLTPGASITIPVVDASQIYVKAASGTVQANWLPRS